MTINPFFESAGFPYSSSSSLLFLLTLSVSLSSAGARSLSYVSLWRRTQYLSLSPLWSCNRGHRCVIERRLPPGSVFLILRHCCQPLPSGGSPNLELNLGIATPGHGLKENRGKLRFPWVPYSMHTGRTMVETNVNSVIGKLSSKRLVATEEHPSPWNGVNPSFFPNQERADRISIDHSKGLPGWPWKMHNQITATLLPPFSVAASSGFSISATFPSSAIFPAISVYYAYQKTWKPFNPILGETYEMVNHGGILGATSYKV
ncbi:AP2-like ethylene-responsive transcription factor TOE2 [Arachis hypogaea]|uniref:AP2-like ethylene-responsive transcription factor TOE2 n=1 Tax=Arachis hypogaea TaxID=3818 RepID=UPI000DEC2F53|nr:uncharacterized protein LOC112756668 [Arachis hypogaea]